MVAVCNLGGCIGLQYATAMKPQDTSQRTEDRGRKSEVWSQEFGLFDSSTLRLFDSSTLRLRGRRRS